MPGLTAKMAKVAAKFASFPAFAADTLLCAHLLFWAPLVVVLSLSDALCVLSSLCMLVVVRCWCARWCLRETQSLRLHKNRLYWIPNEVGKLPLSELTIHENPLREEVLEITELEEVLIYFREQQAPLPYTKALKAHHMQSKIKDGLHELKEGRLHAFRVMLASEDCKVFQGYLEKEFAHENLHFYRDTDSFRARFTSDFPIVSRELREAGLVLYKKYIEEVPELHKFAINIPVSVKKKIDEAFLPGSATPPDQWVFADAYVAITKLMFEDSFKRFLETADGKRIWAIYEPQGHRSHHRKKKDHKKASSSSTKSEKKKTDSEASAVLTDDETSSEA